MAGAAARRYAKAVFELAQEEKAIGAWSRRLEAIREVLEEPMLGTLLSNPTIALRRRREALELVAGKRLGEQGLNLVRMLLETGRLAEIGAIADEFERLTDEAAGRVRATAVTAVELPKRDIDRLVADLSKQFGKDVRLTVEVDPEILGGLVLRVGDQLIDASIRTRLQQLRRRLATV